MATYFAKLAGNWVEIKAALSRLRALVVDDEEAICSLLREVLVDAGFEVDTQSTAEGAWKSINSSTYNLLVTDKNLPDRTGLSLIQQVKQAGMDLPTVVITGYASIPSMTEAFQHGASDYIAKPFDDIGHVSKRLKSVAATRAAKRFYKRVVSDLQSAAITNPADRAELDELSAELATFKEGLRQQLEVLVVDPIGVRARAVSQTLKDWGMTSQAAGDPQVALERLHGSAAPLMAIISLDVPKPSTFVFEARAAEPLTEIIAICEKATLSAALAAVEAGASDLFDLSLEHSPVLRARLQRLLELARSQRLHVYLIAALYRRLRADDQKLAESLVEILPEEQLFYLHHMVDNPVKPPPGTKADIADVFAVTAEIAVPGGMSDTAPTRQAGQESHEAAGTPGGEHRARLADLGVVAAELAHELREPLSGLKAHTQFLLEHQDAKQVRERAKRMLVHIERLERLADRALAYARGELARAGDARCELNAAAEGTYDLASLNLSPKVHLAMQLDPGNPEARADIVMVQQILMNLVANAKHALADRGGEVRIVTRKQGDWVEAEVQDDGPGIPPGLRDRLFEPFVTTKEHATGIGLSLSKRLAEAAGGKLELADSDAGARFRLRLPAVS